MLRLLSANDEGQLPHLADWEQARGFVHRESLIRAKTRALVRESASARCRSVAIAPLLPPPSRLLLHPPH
eukprot:6200942-Pleurochrysis_carterae.AAC.4